VNDIETLCERLRAIPVAVVSDVLAAMGLGNRVLSSAIRAVGSRSPIAGQALCLGGIAAGTTPPATANPHTVYEMDRRVVPGCIAIIATHGNCTGAVVGGNVALSWKLRGCKAIVTDSGIRDASEFAAIDLPVFACFVTPMSNKGLWSFATINEAVTMPGQLGDSIRVAAGDIVHADGDGVAIIPSAHAVQAVRDAELYEAAEARIRADIERGEDREIVYKRHDRVGHIKRVAG